MYSFRPPQACFLVLVTGLSLCSSTSHAAPIYRCEQGGKVLLTDTPCAGSVAPTQNAASTGAPLVPPVSAGLDAAYQTPYGEWRGQAQYHVRATRMPQPTHQVVPVVLTVQTDGKVTGYSPENGCRLSGLAAPGMMPTYLSVDVTAKECRVPDLNQRYFGQLIVDTRNKSAMLSVSGNSPPLSSLSPSGMLQYELRATLRR